MRADPLPHRQEALGWRVVWTLTFCTALSLLGDSTLYAVLPSTYDLVGVTALQVGWLLSVNRLSRLPLNLPSGWLAERVGHKAPYIAGLLVGAVSTVGCGLVRSFWPLLILRALWGVAWALLVVAAYGLILTVSTQTTRGRLVGAYTSFSFFGGAVGAAVGGMLVDALGFSPAFLVLGLGSGVACLVALSLPAVSRPGAALGRLSGTAPQDGARLRRLREGLQGLDARVWLVWALNLAHRFFFAGIFYSTFGYYLRRIWGEDVRWAGLTISVVSLTASLLLMRNGITILTGPVLGYVSDRLGDRQRVLLLGEALGVIGLLGLAISASPGLVVAGVVLVAMAYGVVPSMLMAWLGDLGHGRRREPLVGAYQTMGDLGSGLGPLVAYSLVATLGPQTVYALGAGLLATTIPLIVWSRRRGRP